MGADGGVADREAILVAFDEWEAADDVLAALSVEALTHPELVALLLCGMGYEDNIDRMRIILPNTSAVPMQVEPNDVAVYLLDVVATRVE